VNGETIVEGVKRLQKIHCRTCNADYEACQKCAFHRITNGILAEALNEHRRRLTAEVFAALPEPLLRK